MNRLRMNEGTNQHRPEHDCSDEGPPRRAQRLGNLCLAAVLALALAACNTTPPPGPPTDEYGTLVVLVNGLPTGATGAVSVVGPGSFNEQLVASETLAGL